VEPDAARTDRSLGCVLPATTEDVLKLIQA
jgi:hypothetical protein